MSENRKLTAREIVAGLRCCAEPVGAEGGCESCPVRPLREQLGGENCFDWLLSQAAEEITRMMNATEAICQRETNALVRLAGEAATALERGLAGVNEELFARMQQHQQVLTELGRGSVIHAEPVQEKGWRIDWIQVEGLLVYGEVPEC